MQTQHRIRRNSFARPLTWAVSFAALLGGALPAQAQTQYYDFDGSIFTYPFNFFPIDKFTSFYDFSGNTFVTGLSAPGSFSAFAGAWLKVDGMTVGDGGTGSGTVNVSGGRIDLGGDTDRLVVGNWGVGLMTVSAGGLVDATVNAGACSGCYNFIGNAAGSTGTLTVTGAGSEVRTLRTFIVAKADVDSGFGTPGATTTGSVNILDGGTLRTEGAYMSAGPEGPGATGAEHTVASVSIDGANSRWIVSRNSVDNGAAVFYAGMHANATATIDIANGGKLIVDGTGSVEPFAGIYLGDDGGQADLTVSGIGSEVRIDNAANGNIEVGSSGATGRASFNVLAGASASSLFLNVGRNGAQGTVLVDGAGSTVTMSGVGSPAANGSGFVSIGRDGGNGVMTVSNGGRLLVSDGGGDSRLGGGPGMIVGRGAGSIGALNITGANSTVEIVSTSLGVGTPDNFNPYVSIGYDAGSTGQLSVTAGGKLTLTGNALTSLADRHSTGLIIGGRNEVTVGGSGQAVISGLGSEVRVQGTDAYVSVGRGPGSVGRLDIADRGHLESTGIDVGWAGGNGTLVMDNATARFSGAPFIDGAGPGMTIGAGTGSLGNATLRNGSKISMHGDLSTFGMNVGGGTSLNGGTGSLALESGSMIEASGSEPHAISIGRSLGSVGVMTMTGGSSVALSSINGYVFVGRTAGATGALTMNGESFLNASYVGVGSTPGADGGTGTLLISHSTVTAATIEVGSHGLLGGDEGTINGNLIVRGGALAPGESPGRMIINGGIITTDDGRIILDVASDGHGGFLTDEVILTLGSSFDFGSSTKVIFNFLGDTDLNAFGASGNFNMDTFMLSRDGDIDSGLSSAFAPGTDWGTYFTSDQFSAQSDAYDVNELTFNADGSFGVIAVPVPEPAEWALMLAGLALMFARSAARARSRSARR